MSDGQVDLVVVGSVAIDSVTTPRASREDVLGGSCSYACAAASFFTQVGMVGVVGSDFPEAHEALYAKFGVDAEGLQHQEGKTFRWSGEYSEDMNSRETLSVDLNVFADFQPELPASYRSARYLLLGNISPSLQLHVLSQAEGAEFVVADTMDLWIDIAQMIWSA